MQGCYRNPRLRATPGGAMVGTPEGHMRDLVDVDRGIVSREIFVNEEIYRREQEQVFARAWLFIGHESQIPKPGDFVVSSMGEESVILCEVPIERAQAQQASTAIREQPDGPPGWKPAPARALPKAEI